MKLKEITKVKPGHKGLSTWLSKKLGRTIDPKSVANFLTKADKKKIFSKIKKMAKGKNNPDAYEWGAKRKILQGHFKR